MYTASAPCRMASRPISAVLAGDSSSSWWASSDMAAFVQMVRKAEIIVGSRVYVTGARSVARASRPQAVKYQFASSRTDIRMETTDQRYLVQQNKLADEGKAPPVFAKVMRSKEGKF